MAVVELVGASFKNVEQSLKSVFGLLLNGDGVSRVFLGKLEDSFFL